MSTPIAIKVTAISTPKPVRFGRVQRVILTALSEGRTFTSTELAILAYDRAGATEMNSVNRAIRHLMKKGFNLKSERQGRVDATGFVYLWRLAA